MNISISIPDAVAPRVADAFAATYGYQTEIPDPDDPTNPAKRIPNPESKNAFTRRQIQQYVKDIFASWEASQAANSARVSAHEQAGRDFGT